MTAVNHIPVDKPDRPKDIVIFLDGTANDEGSYTNIAKLHNLVSLQSKTNIRTTYIKGVGTDGKVIGMAMGWGIGHDVREAYLFLADNYNHARGDRIFIFGFSRGAYAARILSSMINSAGIVESSVLKSKEDPYEFVSDIYDAYEGDMTLSDRRLAVQAVIGVEPVPRDVEFLGLWDTVEALGAPDYEENWKVPNKNYGDQLCNVKKAAHALSIDDDRARIFTPILLTHPHLISDCKTVKIDNIVDEVWFSGAHADVGGGYDNTDISGVSLNWMLGKIKKYEITPSNTNVYSNYLDKTNDPEAGIWGLLYRKRNRDLHGYATFNSYNENKLKIHHSVVRRLSKMNPDYHEFQWQKSSFSSCFTQNKEGLEYLESSNCFTVVE